MHRSIIYSDLIQIPGILIEHLLNTLCVKPPLHILLPPMDYLPQPVFSNEFFTPVLPHRLSISTLPFVDSPLPYLHIGCPTCVVLSGWSHHPPCETSIQHFPPMDYLLQHLHMNYPPCPTPPMPTPSVFLTITYCQPAWGLTHSGDLTESSHRLWKEEVDSGIHTDNIEHACLADFTPFSSCHREQALILMGPHGSILPVWEKPSTRWSGPC